MAMAMATWRRRLLRSMNSFTRPYSAGAELGVGDFLKAIGSGVEAHADKVEQEVGGCRGLLLIRSESLKKLNIPCKQRKLILRYTEKYRQGLWLPKADSSGPSP